MNDDMALVKEYATRNSEEAFATLVSRHVGLVHSAALRQVRDPHAAEEITQTVFILLARKAGSLDAKTILPGWLYRTANYVAAAALKIQYRRGKREQEAYMQSLLQEGQTDSSWEKLAPLLDRAMAQLRGRDRDALVLRYFQNKQFREVGERIGGGGRHREETAWSARWKNCARSWRNVGNRFDGDDHRGGAFGKIPCRRRRWRWQIP